MSQQAEKLAERLRIFNTQVITFVENCTEENWRKICAREDWSISVVARHIGAGHYDIIEMANMIVNEKTLPGLTLDQIIQMANEHAREHADCTKTEVLDILRKNGTRLADYVAGLDDAELDRKGYLEVVGGHISTQQLIENVIFQSAAEHFANMKTAQSA